MKNTLDSFSPLNPLVYKWALEQRLYFLLHGGRYLDPGEGYIEENIEVCNVNADIGVITNKILNDLREMGLKDLSGIHLGDLFAEFHWFLPSTKGPSVTGKKSLVLNHKAVERIIVGRLFNFSIKKKHGIENYTKRVKHIFGISDLLYLDQTDNSLGFNIQEIVNPKRAYFYYQKEKAYPYSFYGEDYRNMLLSIQKRKKRPIFLGHKRVPSLSERN